MKLMLLTRSKDHRADSLKTLVKDQDFSNSHYASSDMSVLQTVTTFRGQ